MTQDSPRVVRVSKFASAEEAHLARNLLQVHGIEGVLTDETTGGQVHIAGGDGGVWLSTRFADAERASEILRSAPLADLPPSTAADEARRKLLSIVALGAVVGILAWVITGDWWNAGPAALMTLLVMLLVLPTLRIVWRAIRRVE